MKNSTVIATEQFVGTSLLDGDVDKLKYDRAVFSGRERHSSSHHQNLSYPQRMMMTTLVCAVLCGTLRYRTKWTSQSAQTLLDYSTWSLSIEILSSNRDD